MAIRDWLVERYLGDAVERRAEARVAALREAAGAQRDDAGWRRLSDAERDLSPVTADRMREVAVYLYTHNPLARRMIDILAEWILGEGVRFTAADRRAQEYLWRFWRDPVNRWELRLPQRVRELYLFGEQFWPGFVNGYSGLIRTGVLDPARVREVVLDPDNAQVAIGVVARSGDGGERRIRTLLRGEEREILSAPALAERERMADGELFVFQVNKLSNASRGISELFALADWLDGYEQLLFALLAQERARSSYLWDVTLEGADENALRRRVQTIGSPRALSVRVHNEKESWRLVGPEKGAAASNTESARLFRNQILGGAAIPEHWFGGGGDVNRATAAEMTLPAEKSFTARQREIKYLIEDLLATQLERAIRAGALPDDERVRDVTVDMPDLSTRDLSRVGQAIQAVAAGLGAARGEGWIDDRTATQVIASLLAHTGVEADPAAMLDPNTEPSTRRRK